MRRQLALDGFCSESIPRDIDEMNERFKKTRLGGLEIRTLGVGDNLIVVDDQEDIAQEDKDQTNANNIDNSNATDSSYAKLAHNSKLSIKPDTSVLELTKQL